MNKRILADLIAAKFQEELTSLEASARAAHEAATHEESKAEDAHDTRGLEASYLAGAQMARIDVLKQIITAYKFTEFRPFAERDPVGIGAFVELATEGRKSQIFLVEKGGGVSIEWEGKPLQVISPGTPLGEALIGQRAGDEIEVEAQKGIREYTITAIR